MDKRAQLKALEAKFEKLAWNKNRTEAQEEEYHSLIGQINDLKEELGGPIPRAQTMQNFGGGPRALSGHNGDSSLEYESVGEILQDLYKRSKGEGMTPRLEALRRVTASAIGESIPSSGAVAVPEQLSQSLLETSRTRCACSCATRFR
jgi:HK97 family phage major capsid protein